MTDKINKKRHHFIPKFYLKGFCDQRGMIWAYHKKEPNIIPHCQKPENTAFVKRFYTIYFDNGTIDTNTFEDALADIETPAANALKALVSCKELSSDDRKKLSLLFSCMYVRTPSYRAFYERQHNTELNMLAEANATNKECFRQWWADNHRNINNESLPNDIEQIRQDILNDEYQLEIHPNYSLYIMGKLIDSSEPLFASMKWIIIKAPENLYFLTSDNPIIVINPNHTGFYSPSLLMKDTRVFVPISKEIGLLMIRTDEEKLDNQFVSENSVFVEEINKAITLYAAKFIYYHEKSDKIFRLIENVNSKIKNPNVK